MNKLEASEIIDWARHTKLLQERVELLTVRNERLQAKIVQQEDWINRMDILLCAHCPDNHRWNTIEDELEDAADIAACEAAMAEPGESISLEQLRRKLGLDDEEMQE